LADSSDTRSHPDATGDSDTPRVGLLLLAGDVQPRRGTRCLVCLAQARRASIFLIGENGSIDAMERKIGRPSKGPRAAVIFRMPTPLRIQTQRVLDQLGTSLNDFVEHLVNTDLARPPVSQQDLAPTNLARGRTGKTGRPSKGPRTTVVLKVSHGLAEQIRKRAAALGLSINDYLDSLVSRDISATRRPAGEEMVLDQSA
jgi:hypothetical protein